MSINFKLGDRAIYAQTELFDNQFVNKKGTVLALDIDRNKVLMDFDEYPHRVFVDRCCLESIKKDGTT
jgi:hypothetical protein